MNECNTDDEALEYVGFCCVLLFFWRGGGCLGGRGCLFFVVCFLFCFYLKGLDEYNLKISYLMSRCHEIF